MFFQMSPDDSSSANESSSEATLSKSSFKNLKKLKRPPPPAVSRTNLRNLDQNQTQSQVPDIIDSNSGNEADNNNVLGLVNCTICGRQFGKNSYKFHLRQCQKKQKIIKDRQDAEDRKSVSQSIEEMEGKHELSKFMKVSIFCVRVFKYGYRQKYEVNRLSMSLKTLTLEYLVFKTARFALKLTKESSNIDFVENNYLFLLQMCQNKRHERDPTFILIKKIALS